MLGVMGIVTGLLGAGLVCIPQVLVHGARSQHDLDDALKGLLMSSAAAICFAIAGCAFDARFLLCVNSILSSLQQAVPARVRAAAESELLDLAGLRAGARLRALLRTRARQRRRAVAQTRRHALAVDAASWLPLRFALRSLHVFSRGFPPGYLSQLLHFFLMDSIGAVKTNSVWFLVPFVGLVAGALFLNEWRDYSIDYIVVQCLGTRTGAANRATLSAVLISVV